MFSDFECYISLRAYNLSQQQPISKLKHALSIGLCKTFQTKCLDFEFLSGQKHLIFDKKPWTEYKWVILSKSDCFEHFKLSTQFYRVFYGLSENKKIIEIRSYYRHLKNICLVLYMYSKSMQQRDFLQLTLRVNNLGLEGQILKLKHTFNFLGKGFPDNMLKPEFGLRSKSI